MTGSYFYNKIIIVLALVAFLIGGFYPVSTSAALTEQEKANMTQGAINAYEAAAAATGVKVDPNAKSEIKQVVQRSGDISCVLFSPLSGGTVAGCFAQLSFLILQLAAWVLWLSAIIFNESLKYSLNMAEFIKDMPIVALGWTTFRDVMNLMFVFIILYIGISTIIGNEGYGYKKLLGKVILGAMFINFSLFFTQAMIDVSNIFALQFYNQITIETKAQNSRSGAEANNTDMDSGISAAFVNAMGLQNIWSLGSKTQSSGANETVDINNIGESKLGLNANNLIVVGLGGTVLVLVTAFIFFAATIMFLSRTAVLLFLMILSPVAFMGSILPALSDVSKKWWSTLTSNLIFAPAYMMLLYIVISMITSDSFKGVGGKAGNFADMFAGGNNWTGTAITFVVLVLLMLGCLMIATKFGAMGAKSFESAGFGMAKTLGMGLSGAGVARWAGVGMKDSAVGVARGGAGWAGDKISSSKFLANMSTKPRFGRLAAYTMQQGDKLKDNKIGGKSFNEQVKERQKDYTKRGNLIESALASTPDLPENATALEKTLHGIAKNVNKKRGERAEAAYLKKGRFGYASNAALKKAAKAAKGTDNKEALQSLLSGKFSPKAHENATKDLENVDVELKRLHQKIKNNTDPNQAGTLALQLSSLTQQKNDLNTIIKGHLDTVGKLSNLESK